MLLHDECSSLTAHQKEVSFSPVLKKLLCDCVFLFDDHNELHLARKVQPGYLSRHFETNEIAYSICIAHNFGCSHADAVRDLTAKFVQSLTCNFMCPFPLSQHEVFVC